MSRRTGRHCRLPSDRPIPCIFQAEGLPLPDCPMTRGAGTGRHHIDISGLLGRDRDHTPRPQRRTFLRNPGISRGTGPVLGPTSCPLFIQAVQWRLISVCGWLQFSYHRVVRGYYYPSNSPRRMGTGPVRRRPPAMDRTAHGVQAVGSGCPIPGRVPIISRASPGRMEGCTGTVPKSVMCHH